MTDNKGDEFIDSLFRESEPIDEESRAFIRTLLDESDRGCVLVGAAYLDEEVELLIRDALIKTDDGIRKYVDPLLRGGQGPLGTFWGKITIACAMELIRPSLHDALDKVRKLRNTFAHKAGPVSLSDERVTSLLSKLEEHEQKLAKLIKVVGNDQQSRVKKLIESGTAGVKELEISVHKMVFAFIVGHLISEIKGSRTQYLQRNNGNNPSR